MTLEKIKEQIKKGRLKLSRIECGNRSRRLRIYSKTIGEWIEYPEWSSNENKVIMIKKWMGDLESYKTITFPHINYRAMIDKNKGYKISKKLYNEILKDKLKNDKKAIFTASKKAQEATDYLLSL